MGENTFLTRRSFVILAASLVPADKFGPLYQLLAPREKASVQNKDGATPEAAFSSNSN
jgi:hypothetical protein